MDNVLNYKEILVREPFYEIKPNGFKVHRTVKRGQKVVEPIDRPTMQIITQADFLRMYYPSGHAINDPLLYPDIIKRNKETGQTYVQPIIRTAFAFQRVIATKQVVHIVGNDVQFELSGKVEDEDKELEKQKNMATFRQGWLDMDIEQKFYEFVNSVKIVGDAAIVGYFDKKGNARVRSLSYMKGDTLYPHYDENGELELFARKYTDVDEKGVVNTEYVEVWDDKKVYRARRGISKNKVVQRIKEFFGLSGYEIFDEKEHGYPFCPVVYYREEDGACFLPSQSTIETYEEAFSYFCENNRAYAFPIMWSKGDGVHFNADQITGAVKYIEIEDTDGQVGFMDKPEVSEAFNTQLKLLYDLIYEQAFTVKPPELKSGDLPGVAVKLLFSPAIEQAIHDAQKLQGAINNLVRLVKYAYGMQVGNPTALIELPINAWIEPYIHQNDSELVTNLSVAVQNGFLSHQTASERIPKYSRNDEMQRIIEEDLRKRKLDAQAEVDKMKAQTQEKIEQMKAQQRYGKGGNDVNTGHGGRPRTVGTDENGNRSGEQNWDKWNKTH